MNSKRRLEILKLIDEIYGDSEVKSPVSYENDKFPRSSYISPLDRSTYNYGYLDSFEFFDGFYW